MFTLIEMQFTVFDDIVWVVAWVGTLSPVTHCNDYILLVEKESLSFIRLEFQQSTVVSSL